MTKSATTTTGGKKHPLKHLLAGGMAGLVESSCCHPLDTIKTRVQLATAVGTPSQNSTGHKVGHILSPKRTVTTSLGTIRTASGIIQCEGFFSLYKGLTAVYSGIIPKMAIRFLSFEVYSDRFAALFKSGQRSNATTFFAGLCSGLTEAVVVVTPAEVCKIRMQSQYHSLTDPVQMKNGKYTNVLQTATVIVREEGISALYKGVVPTMLRQGINQAVNFSCYQFSKIKLMKWQGSDLQPWQHLLIGGISGGIGPTLNNPIDVVKTRIQRQVIHPGHEPKYKGLFQGCAIIAKEEGVFALWKGLTPRLMRIVPGQAITFMTYEAVSGYMTKADSLSIG